MKIEEIKIGDIVYLNSGSPPLSVWEVADLICAEWFNTKNELIRDRFNPECLTKTKPEFE